MRPFALLGLLVLATLPAVAQPQSVVLRDALRSPSGAASAFARVATDSEPPGVWAILGTSALGGAIGGGLGALIGTVDPDDLARESGTSISDDEDNGIPLFPVGVWLGTTVGATAGAKADMDGPVPLVSAAGSLMGSLFGLLGGAALGVDDPVGAAFAFGTGGAIGAALPAWAHQVQNVHGRRSVSEQRPGWQIFIQPVWSPQSPAVVPSVIVQRRF